MSVEAQLKSGFKVLNVFKPDSFNWWLNLSRTEILSNSSLSLLDGNVDTELDQTNLSAFGKRIFL
jgi:hypothetical protein